MGVECTCGGTVIMVTCQMATGRTGHDWVLCSVCMSCRSVHWVPEGCLDCNPQAERAELPTISFLAQTQHIAGYAYAVADIESNPHFSYWIGSDAFGFIDGRAATRSPGIQRDQCRTLLSLFGAIRDVMAMRPAWPASPPSSSE